MTEEEKSGGGAAKFCLIGCLVLFIAALVAGFVAVQVVKSGARTLIAKGIEFGFKAGMDGDGISAADQEEVMGPIRGFTQDIRDGNVTLEQGTSVAEDVSKIMGDVMPALQARRFDKTFLQASDLSAEEKQAGSVLVSRYAYGKATGKISGYDITSHMTDSKEVPRSDGQGTRTVTTPKKSLTTEEVRAVLATMKSAVDEGGVPEGKQEVDLQAIVQKAIDVGMTKAGAKQIEVEAPGGG